MSMPIPCDLSPTLLDAVADAEHWHARPPNALTPLSSSGEADRSGAVRLVIATLSLGAGASCIVVKRRVGIGCLSGQIAMWSQVGEIRNESLERRVWWRVGIIALYYGTYVP